MLEEFLNNTTPLFRLLYPDEIWEQISLLENREKETKRLTKDAYYLDFCMDMVKYNNVIHAPECHFGDTEWIKLLKITMEVRNRKNK